MPAKQKSQGANLGQVIQVLQNRSFAKIDPMRDIMA